MTELRSVLFSSSCGRGSLELADVKRYGGWPRARGSLSQILTGSSTFGIGPRSTTFFFSKLNQRVNGAVEGTELLADGLPARRRSRAR